MDISVNSIFAHLRYADFNGDGKFSRQEIANAAIASTDDPNPIIAASPEYSLLYTFLKGGDNGSGLFPDQNRDGLLELEDLQSLASASGNPNGISPEDFTARFGRQSSPSTRNTSDSFQELEAIAGQNFTGQAQANIDQRYPNLQGQSQNLIESSFGQLSLMGQNIIDVLTQRYPQEAQYVQQLFSQFTTGMNDIIAQMRTAFN